MCSELWTLFRTWMTTEGHACSRRRSLLPMSHLSCHPLFSFPIDASLRCLTQICLRRGSKSPGSSSVKNAFLFSLLPSFFFWLLPLSEDEEGSSTKRCGKSVKKSRRGENSARKQLAHSAVIIRTPLLTLSAINWGDAAARCRPAEKIRYLDGGNKLGRGPGIIVVEAALPSYLFFDEMTGIC